MSIRTVQFNLTATGISPSAIQSAGIQGEHNATLIQFVLDYALMLKIQHVAGDDTPLYRIEAVNGAGEKFSTEPKELISDTVEFLLTNQLTQSGTDIRIYLVISVLKNDDTLLDLYSFPAVLSLISLPNGTEVCVKEYTGLTELYKGAQKHAQAAADSAAKAEFNAERTEQAKLTLESGNDFLFVGGDASAAMNMDLVVDSLPDEQSHNPISNAAVTAFIKEQVEAARKEALLLAHPIGSYCFTAREINPAEIFGGEWLQVTYPSISDDTYSYLRTN